MKNIAALMAMLAFVASASSVQSEGITCSDDGASGNVACPAALSMGSMGDGSAIVIGVGILALLGIAGSSSGSH